jgi:ABC-type nickel/cobalt efflux system permease component RcnA
MLGALHGLEPGHSKTMMAAFIVSVRGTVAQAILLGLSATLSHTAVVWIIALTGLYLGQRYQVETHESYLQLASALIMAMIALWMLYHTWRSTQGQHHCHEHDHHQPSSAQHSDAIEHLDAHARAHAEDINRRFANRQVTTGQIVLFGLTGGLIPCPAAITVLLICLQLKNIALGASLVLGFSLGLAITMVGTGTIAALGIKKLSSRWQGLDAIIQRAPYLSALLILLVSGYLAYSGINSSSGSGIH